MFFENDLLNMQKPPETGRCIDPACIRPAGAIGAQVECHETIDSTNDRAKELARAGAPHGTIVLADRQTAGRGRFSRRFYSPAGSGLYLSLILRPKMPAERAVCLTAMLAVAVCRAIEAAANVEARIKWVNDVYIGDKKVCGILCEAGLDASGGVDHIIAGVGINVAPMVFPGDIAGIATSVSNACGKTVPRERVIDALIAQIAALYAGLDDLSFMDEYRRRSNVIGRAVYVQRGDERFPARAVDINNAGSLIVQTADGVLQTLHSGEISIRFDSDFSK